MSKIGKYEIQEEIGRGGFGRVYRAFDPVVQRMVAIKVLDGDGDVQRFRQEATATGRLDHPNIVTVYDFGEHKKQAYIVMEYLEGQDLQ
jgi:serine/threonine protein kinase